MENLRDLLRSTKNNTDHIRQILKIKRILKKTDDELNGLIYELGFETYKAHLSKTENQTLVDELLELISTKRMYIKSLNNELNALNGNTECENCGKITSSDYDFCPFCGSVLFKYKCEKNVGDDEITSGE